MNRASVTGFGSRPLLAFNDPWHDSSFFFADASRAVHVESERFTRRKYEYINPLVVFCEQVPDLVEAFPAIGLQINGELQKYLTRLAMIKHGVVDEPLPRMPFADALLETGSDEERARADSPAVRAFVRHLMRDDVQLYFFGHYASHAANAYYSSDMDQALIVSLDGGGMDFQIPPGGPNHFTSEQIARKVPGTSRRHVYGAVHEGHALVHAAGELELEVGQAVVAHAAAKAHHGRLAHMRAVGQFADRQAREAAGVGQQQLGHPLLGRRQCRQGGLDALENAHVCSPLNGSVVRPRMAAFIVLPPS